MNEKQLFSRNLKAARKKLNLSQAQLAQMLSYSDKAVSKWESGTVLPPSDILPLLAKTLKTDINNLFDFRSESVYFLGIDGGGTKTEFLLTNEKNETIRKLTLSSSNPTSVGIEESANVFYRGIVEICGNIPLGEVSVFIGAAGCGIEQNKNEIHKRLSRLGLSALNIDSDVKNIIAAGLGGQDGVVCIMGTGSIIYTSCENVFHRIGGYGHFIGDTFSGSELGRAALEAVFSALDKSGPKTLLCEKITKELGSDISKILSDMYGAGKTYMASLAHYVFEAAEEGDAVAADILNRNIKRFGRQLSAALSFLPKGKPHKVVLAGGITTYFDKFINKLKNEITADNLEAITVLNKEPVMGAVMLAKEYKNA